ncbi:hypothetical protein BOSP111201_14370 [Bordetella sputigena]
MTDQGSTGTHSSAAQASSDGLTHAAPGRDLGREPAGHADAGIGAATAPGERHDPAIFPIRLLRFLPRALAVALMVLLGLVLVGTVYPLVRARGRDLLNRTWSRCLLRVCGVRLLVQGEPLMQGPVLIVANHVSWLDIFVINAVRPTAFVAKSEIRRWPIVGRLVAGAGTLFLQRGHRHAIHTVGEAMKGRFAQGESVGLFPEGTTTEGFSLLPFHGSLFEPARQAGVAIQPVALRFLRHGRRDAFAAFVGEETLVGNLWRVLGARGLAVETFYLSPLAAEAGGAGGQTRLEMAANARSRIQQALGD